MRPYCLLCGMKHVTQALALLAEVPLGYPLHRWLAYGHLAEAEAELINGFKTYATLIRKERLLIPEDKNPDLLEIVDLLNQEIVDSKKGVSDAGTTKGNNDQ